MITDRFPMLKGLILDMDGVLWHDNEPIGDLPAVFDQIRNLGLDFVLATNNSAKTIEEYQQKLADFGVEVKPEQILTSAVATFSYLRETQPGNNLIYIVGSQSLKADAGKRGFEVLQESDIRQADVVIVGIDQQLTYQKIAFASKQIRSGAEFVATNTDATFPTPAGLVPGAGTMVAAIQTASGKEPVVIGKPSPAMYKQATKVMKLTPDQVLCVGDRLATDILGAQRGGFLSAFLLSGVNSLKDLSTWEPQPDIITKNLTVLING
ncbi:MAG: HAD-IIA family hydrolase [Anaerolineaceae bacterium]|jgi:4-nitrophenyl phosphatase|nr:HAD-IIA family hydrolase [Anaerolineaceae bacterium]MDD4041955.1 HAD-IIA family hydrolase [Anaerolineaceae bacterium]MDD4578887.1 HAD-IIA family hydrolase [Anaerolineaceae bacterium]